MSKILLFITFAISFIASAQLSVTVNEDEPVTSGDTFTFNSLVFEEVELKFKTHNNSTTNTYTAKILCESIENASGSGFELCFGTCYFSVAEGESYPLNQDPPIVLPPGGSNTDFDHLANTYAGDDPELPVKYVFKFYMVDENNNEVGDAVYLNYVYNMNLGTEDVTVVPEVIDLKSNMVKDFLLLEAKESADFQIFSLDGKLIQQQNITLGSHQINVSQLSAGNYILKINTVNGLSYTNKFIKL